MTFHEFRSSVYEFITSAWSSFASNFQSKPKKSTQKREKKRYQRVRQEADLLTCGKPLVTQSGTLTKTGIAASTKFTATSKPQQVPNPIHLQTLP